MKFNCRIRSMPESVENLLYEAFVLQKFQRHKENSNLIKNELTQKKTTNHIKKNNKNRSLSSKYVKIHSHHNKAISLSPNNNDTQHQPTSLECHPSCVTMIRSGKGNKDIDNDKVGCCKENIKPFELKKKREATGSWLESFKDHIHSTDMVLLGDKKTWECPICFDHSKGQEVVTTICGHVFCKNCIEEYLKQVSIKKCPSCRFFIGNSNLITLYNM